MNFYALVGNKPVEVSFVLLPSDDERAVNGLVYAASKNDDVVFNRPVIEHGFRYTDEKGEVVVGSKDEYLKKYTVEISEGRTEVIGPKCECVVIKDNPDFWNVKKWATETNLKEGVKLISRDEYVAALVSDMRSAIEQSQSDEKTNNGQANRV